MKKGIALALVTCLLITGSCRKYQFDSNTDPESINTLNINPDFDWRTSTDVLFNLTNMPLGVIKITNKEGNILFNKGLNNSEEVYTVLVNIPTYINYVAINSQIVEFHTNEVNYSFLDTFKSGMKSGSTNYSMEFDGKDDVISVPDDNSLDLSTEGTLEAWIYIKSNDAFNKYGGIIHKGHKKNWSDEAYSLKLWNSKKARLSIFDGNSEKKLDTNQKLNIKEWYHIAGTWDQNGMKIYINGGLSKETGSSLTVRNTNGKLNIGAQITEVYSKKYKIFPFKGNIDEVRIWNVARTQNQILDNMSKSLTGNETGLVSNYRFNEGTDKTASDLTSNSNDGSIKGAKWSAKVDYIVDSDNDGVSDGDDDFPNDPDKAFSNHYPATGYGSLAFEDLWPGIGDYDFNDLVTDYRFTIITNASNKVLTITGSFAVRAFGAGLHNGFGFQFPNSNVTEQNISVTGYNLQENYITLKANGTESGQALPTIIVFDDAYNILENPGSGTGVNTSTSSPFVDPDTLNIVMTFTSNTYTADEINISGFNPFLIIDLTRGKEVHLPDYAPTSLVDVSLFGTANDASIPAEGIYYKTANNLPWVINMTESFGYPVEKKEISSAHLKFNQWALSNGSTFMDWYKDLASYRKKSFIYEN